MVTLNGASGSGDFALLEEGLCSHSGVLPLTDLQVAATATLHSVRNVQHTGTAGALRR